MIPAPILDYYEADDGSLKLREPQHETRWIEEPVVEGARITEEGAVFTFQIRRYELKRLHCGDWVTYWWIGRDVDRLRAMLERMRDEQGQRLIEGL